MRIIHFYPKSDKLIADYVGMLASGCAAEAEVELCPNVGRLYRLLRAGRADILHIHGCWRLAAAVAARMAARAGARIVLSPHGQLEPWVIRQHFWREKLPCMLFYQRRLVKRAYAVVAMGRMEEGCLERLGWNKRSETVLNALITESIDAPEMCRQMLQVYRKVLDSNTIALMDDNTLTALSLLIKAGQTCDVRWLTPDEQQLCRSLDATALRQLVLYAFQEGFPDIMNRGLQTVGILQPSFDPAAVPCYYPRRFKPADNIDDTGPGEFYDEKVLLRLFLAARRHMRRGTFTITHATTLAHALRQSRADESKLHQLLRDKAIITFTRNLMAVLADYASLEEGFMPVPARRGRMTKKMENLITEHLKI